MTRILRQAGSALIATATGVGIGLLGACSTGAPPPGTKPVDLFPQYGSSCETRIVGAELYDYVDRKRAGNDKFEVTKTAPLRLRFPASYYILQPNHRGGPQVAVQISLQYPDGGPYADRHLCQSGHGKAAGGDDRVNVIISSNLLGATSVLASGEAPLSAEALKRRAQVDLTEDGDQGGFTLYAYHEKAWRAVAPSASKDPLADKLSGASYFGLPKSTSSTIKLIECKQNEKNCELHLFYKSRPVDIVFPKQNIRSAESFARKVVSILEAADVDRK